jgi:hypothetical protein
MIPANVTRGDAIRASDHNAILDELRSLRIRLAKVERGVRGGTAAEEPAQKASVWNNTGGDLPPRSIVALGEQVLSSDGSDLSRRIITGNKPDASVASFAIYPDGVSDGEVADAYCYGICQCTVNVTNETHVYANPVDGVTGYLESGSSGLALMLDREGGTGQQWAIVQWPVGGGGFTSPVVAYVESYQASSSRDYILRQFDIFQKQPYGESFSAYSENAIPYYTGNIVTAIYDSARGWVIVDNYGSVVTPQSLYVFENADLSSDTWNQLEAEETYDGANVEHYRLRWDSTNHALYGVRRLTKITNTGVIADVSVESENKVLPIGNATSTLDLDGSTFGKEPDDTNSWTRPSDKDLEIPMLVRTYWSTEDLKYYGFYRTFTFDRLGMLRSVSIETRVVIFEMDPECSGS